MIIILVLAVWLAMATIDNASLRRTLKAGSEIIMCMRAHPSDRVAGPADTEASDDIESGQDFLKPLIERADNV